LTGRAYQSEIPANTKESFDAKHHNEHHPDNDRGLHKGENSAVV
jgi:hypothetical protein